MSKAEDILLVLNELEEIDLNELKFSVIVDAPSDSTRGYWPFQRGEIIVNDGYGGREHFGEGRKSAKWDVAEESFDTLAEAMECRRKVLAGEWPRCYQ